MKASFNFSWVTVVGFGLIALMLTHEANQPPTSSNDPGDTANSTNQGLLEIPVKKCLNDWEVYGFNAGKL